MSIVHNSKVPLFFFGVFLSSYFYLFPPPLLYLLPFFSKARGTSNVNYYYELMFDSPTLRPPYRGDTT